MLASLENASGEIRYLAAVKGAPETLHAMVRGGNSGKKGGKNGNLGMLGAQNGCSALRGRTGPEPVVR